MSIKTPEQIADEYVGTFTWPRSERIFLSDTQLADVLIAAIEADRAQFATRLAAFIENTEGDDLDAWDQGYTLGVRNALLIIKGERQ